MTFNLSNNTKHKRKATTKLSNKPKKNKCQQTYNYNNPYSVNNIINIVFILIPLTIENIKQISVSI